MHPRDSIEKSSFQNPRLRPLLSTEIPTVISNRMQVLENTVSLPEGLRSLLQLYTKRSSPKLQ